MICPMATVCPSWTYGWVSMWQYRVTTFPACATSAYHPSLHQASRHAVTTRPSLRQCGSDACDGPRIVLSSTPELGTHPYRVVDPERAEEADPTGRPHRAETWTSTDGHTPRPVPDDDTRWRTGCAAWPWRRRPGAGDRTRLIRRGVRRLGPAAPPGAEPWQRGWFTVAALEGDTPRRYAWPRYGRLRTASCPMSPSSEAG
jgi:hypothetical protein